MTTNNLSYSPWEDEDDLVCEYDSTWEGTDCDSEGENTQRNTRRRWRRNRRAAKDMQTYRRGYPDKYESSCWSAHSDVDQEEEMVNLKFYHNEIPLLPDNVYIDEFHSDWKGNYRSLEWGHSYIQWLFPLQEPGLNSYAQDLTKKEIKTFCEDQEAKERLISSYELMLDFYGIRLVDKSTGAVARSKNWMERFDNLNRCTHNNLRITRILKCLGELGFKHYQAPLVKFFLDETLIEDNLAYVKESAMDYFLFSVLDKEKRQKLVKYAFMHYEPKDEFVWCPKKIQKRWMLEIMSLNNLNDQDPEKGVPLHESDQENETNLTEDSPDTSKLFQCGSSSVGPSFDVHDRDPGKGGLLGESRCGQENETKLTEDSHDTSKAAHCQPPPVSPLLERSSVEHSPPVDGEMDQPNFPDSGNEPAQKEGTDAKLESNRVLAETQSNSQDIKHNSTTDDTLAAEQASTLENQKKKEMVGMARDRSDNFPEEIHKPAGKKDGLTDSCNPVQDVGVTGTTDPQLSKSSDSPTAAGEVEGSLSCIGADTESERFLTKGADSREPASAAENNDNDNDSPQLNAKGVESSKPKGGAVESGGPKGVVEEGVCLEGALEPHKPDNAATVLHPPEGGVNESPKPDIGADEAQRPEGAVEDAACGSGAGDVSSLPDEGKTSDDAMMCVDSRQTPGGDIKADEEPMEIDSAQNLSTEASTESTMEH